ncbi:baseplate J/gp47 family protein [Solibacillus isronensis]|uniref:baseplate J/gp47 family protein n=1 Tax=Solibacillus isronensis TaxID=412383 RepID=UPI00399F793B
MLTSRGFKRMRVAEYLPVMQDLARELYGEDVDISDNTPLGKMLYLLAQQRAEDNELAEEIWNSRFIDTSEGASLEANVRRALITKKKWLKASGSVSLQLEKGTNVPSGHLFRTPYNVYFRTLEEVDAVETTIYSVEVKCLDYGIIGNVAAGDISVNVNNITGLISVTNPEAFVNGQDEENDDALKARYYESLSKVGARRIESIEANVLDEVPGVRSCVVIENVEDFYDADGRPPHSFETVVLGGEDELIAQAIFKKKPGGIRAFGKTTTVNVPDDKNFNHPIGFTRAAPVPVFVRIHRKVTNRFPLDGDEQLILRVIEFIGGTHDDVKYEGLGMNVDVILARLESRLFAVEGLDDVRVELSSDGEIYTDANLSIAFPEVAETDESKIEVLPLE